MHIQKSGEEFLVAYTANNQTGLKQRCVQPHFKSQQNHYPPLPVTQEQQHSVRYTIPALLTVKQYIPYKHYYQ